MNRLVDSVRDPSVGEREKNISIEHIISIGQTTFEIIARRYAVYPGLDIVRDFDDLVQIVREQAWNILREMARGGGRPGSFEAQLSMSSHAAIRDYADSGATTMVSRGGAAQRRARIEIAQRELESRLSPHSNRSHTSVTFGVEVERPSQEDASAHLEMKSVIDRTLRTIESLESPVLLTVAHRLLDWFPDGDEPTVASIARDLHLPWTTTTRYCEEARTIFRQVFRGS
jgi:hypothetical protein